MPNYPIPPSEVDLARIKTFKVDVESGHVYSWEGYELGGKDKKGYIRIAAAIKYYKRSNIVWWAATGKWPEVIIDHENRIKDDDRLVNLREATSRANSSNIEKANELPTGVSPFPHYKAKPFQAQANLNGKRTHLGFFTTAEEASKAYQEAIREV